MIAEKENIWYVVYTKPNFERKLAAVLMQKGLEVYLPEQKQLKQYSDRKKWVNVILFRSYVFVKADDYIKKKEAVLYCPGYLKMLLHNGKPSDISQSDIDKIKLLTNQEKPISVVEGGLEIGEQIEIKEGIFKGIRGVVIEKQNNKQLVVKISGLDQKLVIDI